MSRINPKICFRFLKKRRYDTCWVFIRTPLGYGLSSPSKSDLAEAKVAFAFLEPCCLNIQFRIASEVRRAFQSTDEGGRVDRRKCSDHYEFMKAVIQRVQQASVGVDGKVISSIEKGFLTLLGVAKGDSEEQLQKLIAKIIALRIFPDENGKMNLSLKDIGGAHLIVSQFTLLGDASRGHRPSFIGAEAPEIASKLYDKALELSRAQGIPTFGGQFGADMKVQLLNDGPVTLILEV